MIAWIDDLFLYNDWAGGKVIDLCSGLSDDQLDTELPIGFGTLRKTLFHIFAADQIWLERWQQVPWRPFPTDPAGMTVAEIGQRLHEVSAARRQWLANFAADPWASMCEFQDSQKTPFCFCLADLLLHVVNHGIHHRAQSLAYLKAFGSQIPRGIDYIYYRTATAATKQSEAGQKMFAEFGLDYNTVDGDSVQWNKRYLQRAFEYHDWANERILAWAAELSDEQLRHDHNMGPDGTMLGVLQHLVDVEWWWTNSCQGHACNFGSRSGKETVAEIGKLWQDLSSQRDIVLEQADRESFGDRLLTINFGGPDLCYSITEGLTQLVLHAVHHRAQLINLLRRNNVAIENIDLLYGLADLS